MPSRVVAVAARKAMLGSEKVIFTVCGSTTVISLTARDIPRAGGRGIAFSASKFALTTDASSVVPSLKVTSSRSSNVYSVASSLIFHERGEPGHDGRTRSAATGR